MRARILSLRRAFTAIQYTPVRRFRGEEIIPVKYRGGGGYVLPCHVECVEWVTMDNLKLINNDAAKRCDAHMNELPVPCGPWEPWYKDKQAFYNKVLISGALWWVFSFVMMIWTDSILLLWGPPCQPGPPSDMVEGCEDEDS